MKSFIIIKTTNNKDSVNGIIKKRMIRKGKRRTVANKDKTTSLYTQIYKHACTHVYIHACTHVCTHMCIYLYTHMHIHPHTCIHICTWRETDRQAAMFRVRESPNSESAK